MATCKICQKKSNQAGGYTKTRAQYNPTGKTRKKPNLQDAYVPEDVQKEPYQNFAGQTVKMCTKCMKAMSK